MDKLSKVIFYLVTTIVAISQPTGATNTATPHSHAIFIFGDSSVDVGTNSLLPNSTAISNFPHNGIDFPGSKPTGRFSNGFNNADFLSKLLGHKRSPQPYLFLRKEGMGKRIFRGANFASGGAGIFDATGKQSIVVPMSDQIKQFKTIHDNLSLVKGRTAAKKMIAKSLFIISIGANDIFGHFSTQRKPELDPTVLIGSLIVAYKDQIKSLYKLGARKFAIIDVPPIGCCPSQRLRNITGGCFDVENTFAQAFNSKLDALLKKLSYKLSGMKYSLGNSYGMTMTVLNNPRRFNITYVDRACCGEGRMNAEKACTPTANLCMNRHEYLCWDWVHLTQHVSELTAISLYNGGLQFATPINFAQLAGS